jgi:hypothetical protein
LLDFCEHGVSVGFKIFIGKVPHLFSHVCRHLLWCSGCSSHILMI